MSDFKVGDTLYHHFSTRAFATGIPTTLAGTPVAEAYEEASAVGITAGVSLTIDHGETGHHLLTVVATGANSFETGKIYGVSLTAGTVGGVSVVGEVIFNFSLEKSAAAQDLANGTDGLGAIKAETALIVGDTAGIAGATMRGTDSALLASSAPTNFSDMSITVTTGLLDITQAAADKVWSTTTRTLTAFSTALALSVWDVLESAIVTASSIGLKVKNNLDAVLTARTLPTASYFDPAADTVVNVTTVATLSGHTAQTGDTFALANGASGFVALKAETVLILADVTGLAGAAMRGTDSALLASAAPTNFGDLSISVTTGLVNLVADQSAVTIGTVNALGATAKADVNAEMVDTLTVDTMAELAQAIPAANPTIVTALMASYMQTRNKFDVTASFLEVHNNAGVVIFKKSLSDDGTTYSEAETVAGP